MPKESPGNLVLSPLRIIWSLLNFLDHSGHIYPMTSDVFLAYQAIEDPEFLLGLQSPQLRTKATTAILGVSTIPAHSQSTSNVSNHIKITHLTGALHYHLQALEIHNLH